MAAGDRLLDSSGNVILDSSGNIMLSDGAGDACCCGGTPETIQPNYCSTGAPAPIWLAYDSTAGTVDIPTLGDGMSLPLFFWFAGQCYHVTSDGTTSTTHEPTAFSGAQSRTECCTYDCVSGNCSETTGGYFHSLSDCNAMCKQCGSYGPHSLTLTISGIADDPDPSLPQPNYSMSNGAYTLTGSCDTFRCSWTCPFVDGAADGDPCNQSGGVGIDCDGTYGGNTLHFIAGIMKTNCLGRQFFDFSGRTSNGSWTTVLGSYSLDDGSGHTCSATISL